MVTICAVPSTVATVKVSVSVPPALSASHRRIAVVERVGPHPGCIDREGAVAVGARGGRADHRQVSAGLSTSVELRSPVAVGIARRAVVDAAGFRHRPGRSSPVITAASLVPLIVMVTSCVAVPPWPSSISTV